MRGDNDRSHWLGRFCRSDRFRSSRLGKGGLQLKAGWGWFHSSGFFSRKNKIEGVDEVEPLEVSGNHRIQRSP